MPKMKKIGTALAQFVPVVRDIVNQNIANNRDEEIYNLKKEEFLREKQPVRNAYGIPSFEEESAMRSEYENQDAVKNYRKFQEMKKQRELEGRSVPRPLTQLEDQYFERDLEQNAVPEPAPFISKREAFEKARGYSPDMSIAQLKAQSEADENIAQARRFGAEADFIASGGKTKQDQYVYVNPEDINDVRLEPFEGSYKVKAGTAYAQGMINSRAAKKAEEGEDDRPVILQSEALKSGKVPKGAVIVPDGGLPENKPLAGEALRLFENSKSGVDNVNQMLDILDTKPDIFRKVGAFGRLGAIGDDDAQRYLAAKKEVQDVWTRIRTGAALNKEEIEFYGGIVTDISRSENVNKERLEKLGQFFENVQVDIANGKRKLLEPTKLRKTDDAVIKEYFDNPEIPQILKDKATAALKMNYSKKDIIKAFEKSVGGK